MRRDGTMGRWFRLDDDVVNDPKVQQLDPVLFKAWINILCIASKHGGVLPDMAGCAFMLRTDVREAERVIAALADGGLLDPVKDGLEPHNWTKRQRVSDISTSRVKRHRAKGSKRGGPVSGNGPGNAHETVSGNGNETPPE